MRRFDLDAAIVFSDILVVPYALGQKVEFVEGEGPKLEPVRNGKDLARLDRAAAEARFAPVYETLARVVPGLPEGVPVIGFCGAPWTVATYMVEGGGSKDQTEARLWAYRDPTSFQSLIDLLVETSIAYLLGQVKAGAGALQIFDSWAGSLPNDEFARWCSYPTRAIVAGVKAVNPDVPDHRLSAGLRCLCRTLCARDQGRRHRLRYQHVAGLYVTRFYRAGCPCRAISIRCCLWWAACILSAA